MLIPISRRQFDAYCYSRSPYIRYVAKELAWYTVFDKKLIAAIAMDYTDRDYSYIILARDKRKVFRTLEPPLDFYDSQEEAVEELKKALAKYENDGKEIYEQGDEKALPNELLTPQVADSKLHRHFTVLQSRGHESARKILAEIAYSFVDVDGNYIKDFQTTGFDARLWELYLYVYLYSSGYKIDNSFQAPDYLISFFGERAAIEAVTVNANKNFDEAAPKTLKDVLRLNHDYMPIKFGSSLFSKLQKKYWEKAHVKGIPFILAIHDFHMPSTLESFGSMTWSRDALGDYLYGYRMKVTIEEDGSIKRHIRDNGRHIEPIMEKIETHEWNEKTIPSNFFGLPDSENVSAVLFSNNATLATFNRMGKIAGLGTDTVKMLRHVRMYDPDPYAVDPIEMTLDLDSRDYEEGWADGLIMFHNPKAKFPVDADMFPDISHMYFDLEDLVMHGKVQPSNIISSVTQCLIAKP
ncbi:MAG: hypothetical protein V4450_13695 [Bacteroidota bacterium]